MFARYDLADELLVIAVKLVLKARKARPRHCPTCGAFPMDA